MSINNINVSGHGKIEGNIYQGSVFGEKIGDDEERHEQDSRYDVAVSYASEQEQLVRRVVKVLKKEGLKVFFAPDCEYEYKGKDMFEQFYDIFRFRSKYVVCFVSKEYLNKDYTRQEYEAAKIKSEMDKVGSPIIVSFGGVVPPRLDKDINYIAVKENNETWIAGEILKMIL